MVSRRNKLEKFAELLSFGNVYQNYDFLDPKLRGVQGQEVDLKGRWRSEHFRNEGKLILELACGGGEYTLGLAQLHPQRNFVGVDVKGNRIWKGARKALANGVNNAAFLRTRIEQIHLFFAPEEVDEIWITFPDPFPRKSKANRRLTNTNFIDRYAKILVSGGSLHLKTDASPLFEFTQELWQHDERLTIEEDLEDVYASSPLPAELSIKTFYEIAHLAEGRTIHYLRARYLTYSA